MPRLKMLRGPKPEMEIELVDDVVTIGRGRLNTIIIHDNEVSRYHCRFVRVLEDYEIHDNGSTNGTFVNGQRVDQGGWLLATRSIIELGDSITLEYLPTETASIYGAAALNNLNVDLQTYYLVMKRISQPEPEQYPLHESTIAIGRHIENDIVLPEQEVSRHHIRLVLDEKGYSIEDLGTLNGTEVNGVRVQGRVRLRPNDYIKIGTSVEMWYTDDPEKVELKPRQGGGRRSEAPTRPTKPRDLMGLPPLEQTQMSNVGHGLVPDQLLGHVFVAYPRSTWEKVVGPLMVYMQDQGVHAWADQYLLPDSDDWTLAIDQAQSECALLLIVVTAETLQIPYIQRAVNFFTAREKPILLLNVEHIDALPLALENTPAVMYQPKNREATFSRLVVEMRRRSIITDLNDDE